jgi:hypothetical protein
MRNTTKLKAILLKYSVCLDMSDDGLFTMNLVDKMHPDKMQTIEGKSYSYVLTKAYSYLQAELKNEGIRRPKKLAN